MADSADSGPVTRSQSRAAARLLNQPPGAEPTDDEGKVVCDASFLPGREGPKPQISGGDTHGRADPGGPAAADPGGPAAADPGGPAAADPGRPAAADPGGLMAADPEQQAIPQVKADSVDNATLLGAVQSLGQALEGYSLRVDVIEERIQQLCSPPASNAAVAPTGVINSTHGESSGLASHTDIRRSEAGDHSCLACPAAVGGIRQLAKPGEFDGSGSWASFIAQFNVIASAQKWNEAERLAVLVASLKGSALELFARLPGTDKTNFHRLIKALEDRFGIANQEPWFRSQLRRRKREAGESLPHLAQEIERLTSLAYPSATVELRDSLACDHFMDALGDAELHIAVRQGRPSSLPQALASAVEIESVRRAAGLTALSPAPEVLIRQSHGPQRHAASHAPTNQADPSTRGVLQEILRTLNELQRSLRESGRSGNSRRSSAAAGRQPAGACWECGTVGHFRRDCPRITGNSARPQNQQGNA